MTNEKSNDWFSHNKFGISNPVLKLFVPNQCIHSSAKTFIKLSSNFWCYLALKKVLFYWWVASIMHYCMKPAILFRIRTIKSILVLGGNMVLSTPNPICPRRTWCNLSLLVSVNIQRSDCR